MTKKILAVLLSAAMLVSALSCFANAVVVDVEIDLEDLFAEDVPETKPEDGGDTSVPDDDDKTDDKTDDDEKDDDEKDDDDKKKPSSNKGSSTGSLGKKDDDDAEDEKKEEPAEPVVYNSTFVDVKEDEWFYSYVTDLASKGIIKGYELEDGTFDFKPQNNITRAEFLKLIVECMGYEESAHPVFSDVPENEWFYTVVSTAAKNGVISTEEYGENLNPNEIITRKEVARLLVKATGVEVGKKVYVSPYEDAEDEYVTALYTICLMQGQTDNDGKRYFNPDSNITRAETSTVFSRLLEYNADPEAFVKAKTEEYGMTALEEVANINYIDNMTDIGENPMSCFLYYVADDADFSHNDFSLGMTETFSSLVSHFPETFAFTSLNIEKQQKPNGTAVKIYLSETSEQLTMSELCSMRKMAEDKTKEIVAELFSADTEYTQRETVEKIYKYLVDNVEYSFDDTSDIDGTAYGALAGKRAVCQGYSAAFNLLCIEAGIKSLAVEAENHSWNAVFIDEGVLYCDAAYEDSSYAFSETENEGANNLCLVTHDKMEKLQGKFDMPLAIYFDLE